MGLERTSKAIRPTTWWWPVALVLVIGCGQGQTLPPDPQVAVGAAHYQSTCAVCHGRDAGGLRGLGSPLVGGSFVGSHSDEEVVAFVVSGRSRQDPANSTGLPMPPRGGNPRLDDEDLGAIVAYLRFLASTPT